jgi:hypothetical protein
MWVLGVSPFSSAEITGENECQWYSLLILRTREDVEPEISVKSMASLALT